MRSGVELPRSKDQPWYIVFKTVKEIDGKRVESRELESEFSEKPHALNWLARLGEKDWVVVAHNLERDEG